MLSGAFSLLASLFFFSFFVKVTGSAKTKSTCLPDVDRCHCPAIPSSVEGRGSQGGETGTRNPYHRASLGTSAGTWRVPKLVRASSALPLTQRALQPAAESGLQLGCQAAVRGPGATGAGKPALRARLEVEGCGQERAAEGGSWPPGILPPSLSLEVGRIGPPSQRRPHADQRLLGRAQHRGPPPQFPLSPAPRREGG